MEVNSMLRRLEVLKNVIVLQDVDDIEFQAGKLEKLSGSEPDNNLNDEIKTILTLIEGKAYGNAMEQINALLNRYNTLSKWTDPEVQGLRTEVSVLSAEVAALESELGEIDKTIHAFEVKQVAALGDIILKILDLKKEIAARKIKENPQDIEAQNQYHESEADEKEYKGIYEDARANPVQILTPEEEHEIKNLFRKIVKLTHPDLVDKQFEKQAAALFDKAKNAKDNNDLHALKEIYDYLVNGTPFSLKQETITEKELLKKEVSHLRTVIQQLKQKISDIQNSDTWKAITSITNWDAYFDQTQKTLQQEFEKLTSQANG